MIHTVHCPVCNHRLFDAGSTARGSIEIKCPRCRQVQRILLYQTAPGNQLKTVRKPT